MLTNNRGKMALLKEQGYSYAAIGALYGISRQRVHQITSGYEWLHNTLTYKNGRYRQIHDSIIKRDDNKCQKCGRDSNLIVHHIDGNNKNNSATNLVTLCNDCHLDLHRPHSKRLKIMLIPTTGEREPIDPIQVFEAERVQRQLNHRAFSTLVGIHESTWSEIRKGKRSLNLNHLTLLMQKLPEVTPAVTILIMKQGNDGDNEKRGQEINDPDNSEKTLSKTGVETPSDYLGHGKPRQPPK